ncbi:MAG: peptidylprolyl isomerase [Acidobacteriaceae bacterium]
MMLRVPSLPAILAAGLALTVLPAVAQNDPLAADAAQSTPYSGTVVEAIVARVNDQVISMSDYERAEQQLEQEAQQQNWSQQELYQQRHDLLRSLIDRQLLLSKGKELGINADTEVIRRLDEMRKEYHLDSMDALQKAAEAQGVSWEDLKEQIRENVITSDVISQEVAPHIEVTPSETRDYYNTHKDEFERPEEVHLSEILIPTPNDEDAAQVAQAEKQADNIEDRLKAGADFATLAKADSGGPTAAQGGDLGDYKRGVLPKVMEDATFDLKPGQWTAPIRTKQGWLILDVTQHQDAGEEPYTQVQNQIQETVGMAKMQPALRDYLAQLRNEAYIEIAPGYVDAGATGHEQKFIQAAFVPPQPKHKKHETRSRFRQKPPRRQKTQAAGGGVPAGVPTLDRVNEQSSGTAVAGSRTQKPGKKEKIRFGQAPRETLPAADTRMVNAGAGVTGSQVATNQTNSGVTLTNANGDVIDNTAPAPKKNKVRFQDQGRTAKSKRVNAKKHQKFVPPTETPAEVAQDKRQDAAYGLNGDTSKHKKAKPSKKGPKRRLSDEEKKKEQQQNGTPTAPAAAATPSTQGTAPQS